MSAILGIDLGTTNTVAAIVIDGEPIAILNERGLALTPSVVSMAGERIDVGVDALNQALIYPTVRSAKRFIGRSFAECEKDIKFAGCPVINQAGKPAFQLGDLIRTPEQIAALILSRVKEDAERYLGHVIDEAVITVPAYFNDAQRTATMAAGRLAGFRIVHHLVHEPTAAALAHGITGTKKGEYVLVWDLGGGTFDVSILWIGQGVFNVLATSGDTQLGGNDWDNLITGWIIDQFKELNNYDPLENENNLPRMMKAAEEAKIRLTGSKEIVIALPFLNAEKGKVNFSATLTQGQFEEMSAELLERVECAHNLALSDAGISEQQIDRVVLVGGSTRMPMISALAKKLTGKTPDRSANPDRAVAFGAAIKGAMISGKQDSFLLTDILPISIGVGLVGDVYQIVVPRGTTIPTRKTIPLTSVKDGQRFCTIQIYQGERLVASENSFLARLRVAMPPADHGSIPVELAITVDADGICEISAHNSATGEKHVIEAEAGRLPDNEVERLIQEAEAKAEEDRLVLAITKTRRYIVTIARKPAMRRKAEKDPEVAKLLEEARNASQISDINQLQEIAGKLKDAYEQTELATV